MLDAMLQVYPSGRVPVANGCARPAVQHLLLQVARRSAGWHRPAHWIRCLRLAPKIGEARHTEIVDRIVARAERQPRTGGGRFAAGCSTACQQMVGANSYAGCGNWRRPLALGILAGQNATIGTLATSAFSGS